MFKLLPQLAALAVLSAASIATPAAAAAVIAPTSVSATSTFATYDVGSLIDGSGLVGDLHDATYSNMWMTDLGVDAATLTFDLGAVQKLWSVDVWNYNFGREEFASTLDRAAKAYTFAFSLDGVTYTDALSGAFSRGTGQPLAAETLSLAGAQARYVQIKLSGNHQQYPEYYGYAPVGLSEVQFSGSAVPEPATWAMMIAGFGLAGSALRSARRTVRFA